MINFLHIPKGVRLISWATATRFVGWGLVETFIPVFLLSFVGNFTETGLLRSVYDVVFLLSLPIISRLADRFSSKKVILSGLVLYPLISLSYYFAGIYGAVGFIILARALNGVSYALDSVGKKTYIRRHAHEHTGLMFGYFESVSYFWWLVAAVVGYFLMNVVPFHQLFLFIIPTTLIAMVFIAKIPPEHSEGSLQGAHDSSLGLKPARRPMVGISPARVVGEILRDYRDMFGFVWKWKAEQKYTAVLYALMGSLFIVTGFFLPLASFANTHDYAMIFLLTGFAVLPFIFGVPLGLLADHADKRSLRTSMLMAILFLVLVPFIDALWLMLGVVFASGLCVYYSMLVLERAATDHETRAHMGSLSGAFLSVFQLAQIITPIAVGFLIDIHSLQFAIFAIAALGLLVVMPLFHKKVTISM